CEKPRRLFDTFAFQGRIRHVGVSGYPLGALARVVRTATVDFVLSYCHFNPFNDQLTGLLELCEQRGEREAERMCAGGFLCPHSSLHLSSSSSPSFTSSSLSPLLLMSPGVGVINASPLHMGRATASGGPAWHPAPAEVKAAAAAARDACTLRETTL